MRARRRDVDDASPAGLDHVGQHGLDAVEDPVQVDVHDPLPVLERDVGELLEAVDARGVHQNRDRAELAWMPSARRRPRAVGDVGGVGEFGVGRDSGRRGDLVPSARSRWRSPCRCRNRSSMTTAVFHQVRVTHGEATAPPAERTALAARMVPLKSQKSTPIRSLRRCVAKRPRPARDAAFEALDGQCHERGRSGLLSQR